MVKKVFTTGQVARICNVTTQTVTKWIDSGRLKGYRIPGSRARRVTRGDLKKFIEDHKIPGDYFAASNYTVLAVSPGNDLAEDVGKALGDDARFVVESARDPLYAGLAIATLRPDVVIVDTDEISVDVHEVARLLASREASSEPRFVAAARLPEGPSEKSRQRQLPTEKKAHLTALGYDAVVVRPFEISDFLRVVLRMAGLD